MAGRVISSDFLMIRTIEIASLDMKSKDTDTRTMILGLGEPPNAGD